LWADGRTDEDQLGMSYLELEQAMLHDEDESGVSNKQHRDNLKLFREIRARNLHKMQPIPIFKRK
jgi:NAD+ synthase